MTITIVIYSQSGFMQNFSDFHNLVLYDSPFIFLLVSQLFSIQIVAEQSK